MSEFIDKNQPAELLDSISPYVDAYSPLGKDLKKIAEDQAESLEKILQSFEQGNPALLSDELANGFIPVLTGQIKSLRKVIPYLKEKSRSGSNMKPLKILPRMVFLKVASRMCCVRLMNRQTACRRLFITKRIKNRLMATHGDFLLPLRRK